MEKKYKIALLLATTIAAFFYAAVWTCESNSLSQKLLFSGFVAAGHTIVAMLFCGIAYDFFD